MRGLVLGANRRRCHGSSARNSLACITHPQNNDVDANWLGIMTGLCLLLEGLIVTSVQCKWPHYLKEEAKQEVRSKPDWPPLVISFPPCLPPPPCRRLPPSRSSYYSAGVRPAFLG